MKVRELIVRLLDMGMDYEVVLSSDSEGNGFSKLLDVQPCHFAGGELVDVEEANAVVLWP